MLKITLPEASKQVASHPFEVMTRGQNVRLNLRPLTQEVAEAIDRKHTKHELAKDPDTRQMARVPIFNSDAALDEKIDYVVANIHDDDLSVTDERTGKPILNTSLRAKKALLFMKQPDGEQPLLAQVFDASRELAVAVQEEKVAELGNS